ncbi:SDR family oxidoreductase [Costertonia aggregata]|uniref:SDR family oxidoreductase n=1 Tax=Costertonia aggregata TaxID=343403 RepID=A0A7H9AN99_9FLAO|nr:SDR family oxidoreductase [Costertonia aggregata]QLG44910.1 SDR family oxidoreductase [Costertonia aggregata]
MSKTIGIMGCGWLGLPLAKALLSHGYIIKGTTTSKEKLGILKSEGIRPFRISLSENSIYGPISDFLMSVHTLIVNVPPRLRSGNAENYVDKMQLLFDEIRKSKVHHIVFVSSTSVYGDLEGDVDESTPPIPKTESGKQLLASEEIARKSALDTTIIRFGGLIGPDRHPVTMLSGRKGLSNGNAPVNLIHLDDCIQIIVALLKNNWWNETFNAVYPYHPSKKKYYTLQAKKRGLSPPDYSADSNQKGKKIHSRKLIRVKNYDFNTTIL